MANIGLAVLEDALRARKLDRTLTNALAPLDRTDPAALVPTQIAALDERLRGGLPRGQVSEICGPRSAGRTTLLVQLLAAATQRGEIAAVVDTCDRLDVHSAVAAGVDLDRLLWIRCQAPQEQLVDRALKALNLVLQAGSFGLVAIDLADVPAAALARMPFTTWPRVQRTIEGRDTACVIVGAQPIARSAGGLTLTLSGETRWAGDGARSRRVDGLDLVVRLVSPRQRVQGDARVCCDSRD